MPKLKFIAVIGPESVGTVWVPLLPPGSGTVYIGDAIGTVKPYHVGRRVYRSGVDSVRVEGAKAFKARVEARECRGTVRRRGAMLESIRRRIARSLEATNRAKREAALSTFLAIVPVLELPEGFDES